MLAFELPPGAGLRLRLRLLSAVFGFEEDATGWSFFLWTGNSILPIILGPESCFAFALITSSSSAATSSVSESGLAAGGTTFAALTGSVTFSSALISSFASSTTFSSLFSTGAGFISCGFSTTTSFFTTSVTTFDCFKTTSLTASGCFTTTLSSFAFLSGRVFEFRLFKSILPIILTPGFETVSGCG